ncbi:MAG: membrane protein of unknown function [Promethearchaeota archaeon]|jgi:hypothetical protein|nr:MAG: membrane protein of unknown function [Candidatus Lokiarchaeota archaeon]
MGFLSGLKRLFSKWIYALVVLSFIVSWFLILFGSTFIPFEQYNRIVVIFIEILFGFCFVLFVFSFFKPIDDLPLYLIILAFLIGLPLILIFLNIFSLFFLFCVVANQILTAFFAFKVCMDTAIKSDTYLYEKEPLRIPGRIIEFILFGGLNWWLLRITGTYFNKFSGGNSDLLFLFRLISWIDLILLGIVLLRLLLIQKFAAYISLFLLLSFFYTFYRIFDIFATIIIPDSATYKISSFFIDLLIFLYIIGAIFDRIDYLKEKLRIIRADTIAFFIILMKLIVQVSKIFPNIPGVEVPPDIRQDIAILLIFIFFTLLIGIYTIFRHKMGNKKRKNN